jgi:hypothetical protein
MRKLLVTAGLFLLSASSAHAAFVFEQQLTTQEPGAASGARLHLVYPDGEDGRPKQAAEAVYEFPPGTRIHESAVPACEASDADFNARGLGACPGETRLGGGTLSAITGCGPPFDPFETDIHSFHGPAQVVNAITPRGAERPILSVARIQIEGDRLVDRPALPPGCPPPDGRAAPREVDLELAADGRGFFTAPPECPAAGLWTSTVQIRFTDGSQAAGSSSAPCLRPADPEPPATRLTLSPSRVRAGRPARIDALVSSTAAECRGGVVVRFGNRRFTTGASGLARLAFVPHRTGLRRVVARKPGCATANAYVRVLTARARGR